MVIYCELNQCYFLSLSPLGPGQRELEPLQPHPKDTPSSGAGAGRGLGYLVPVTCDLSLTLFTVF